MSHVYFDAVSDTSVSAPRHAGLYRRGGKRLIDVLVVLVCSPIILPVVAIIWLVTIASGGPGFYGQPRVGRHEKVFYCWKIRTMSRGADTTLAKYLRSDPDAAREWHKTQKLKNDPRITKFGRFLRVSSLDEFPQFWNVLKGDMSLIGPRPFAVNQKNLYDEASADGSYYNYRPGLSGLWQVLSRNEGEFRDRVAFDEEYAVNITLATDIKIVFRTFAVLSRATGK